MNVEAVNAINPDEWRPVARVAVAVNDEYAAAAADYQQRDIRAAAAVLCFLDLARHGTVRWFPHTDPADVPWAPTPELVRCVDVDGVAHALTEGKVYQVLRGNPHGLVVVDDKGNHQWYFIRRFVPVTADDATVTIDVPVAWARWAAGLGPWPGMKDDVPVHDACREALTKAGLL